MSSLFQHAGCKTGPSAGERSAPLRKTPAGIARSVNVEGGRRPVCVSSRIAGGIRKPPRRGLENGCCGLGLEFPFVPRRASAAGADKACRLVLAKRVPTRSDCFNRPMPQAPCCQARRQAIRGAQQSPDSEHPSEPGNAAWRHEAPRHRPIGRRTGKRAAPRDMGGFFCFVFFHVEENEETN